jgi:hypothetical protein
LKTVDVLEDTKEELEKAKKLKEAAEKVNDRIESRLKTERFLL